MRTIDSRRRKLELKVEHKRSVNREGREKVRKEVRTSIQNRGRFSKFENEAHKKPEVGHSGPALKSTVHVVKTVVKGRVTRVDTFKAKIESKNRKPKTSVFRRIDTYQKKFGKCWKCLEVNPNHHRRDCPNPRSIREERIQCLFCKQRGHKAMNCQVREVEELLEGYKV